MCVCARMHAFGVCGYIMLLCITYVMWMRVSGHDPTHLSDSFIIWSVSDLINYRALW